MFRIAVLPLFLTGTGSGDEGGSLSASVSRYLESRESAFPSESFRDEDREEILHRPDPETQFLYYAFGLKKHAAALLSPDQALALNAVIEKHAPVHSRWHDERNTVRCYWNRLLWIHAGADLGEAEKIHAELATWMDLRMKWTRQEHLAQFRFARDVWDVLNSEQQEKLLSGAWKSFAKQETGHGRGDATAKIITRALGKPDGTKAFASRKERPELRILVWDGTKCFNYEFNLKFSAYLKELGITHEFLSIPDVPHTVTGSYDVKGDEIMRHHQKTFAEFKPTAP